MTVRPTATRGTAGPLFRDLREDQHVGDWHIATTARVSSTLLDAWEAGDDSALTARQVRDVVAAMGRILLARMRAFEEYVDATILNDRKDGVA